MLFKSGNLFTMSTKLMFGADEMSKLIFRVTWHFNTVEEIYGKKNPIKIITDMKVIAFLQKLKGLGSHVCDILF